MNAIRQHDVTVADGTFSVVLTRQNRLIASIHAPLTPLGPLHLVFEMDRGIHPELLRREALARRGLHPQHIMVGGIFDDIGSFVSKAAEGAFNSVSKAVTTITKPVFNVTKEIVSHTMKGIASVTPFLPSNVRNDISNAARIVARARLGDMTAKQFVRTIGQAAKAGVGAAQKIGDALLDGTKLVARVIDLPVHLLKHVPGVGDIVTSISPLQKFDHMVSAVQRGDLNALKKMVTDDLHTFQGVASLIPGIGTGISSGLSAGLAALDGGSPIEIAVSAAYGAIPIPVGIRTVTDSVLASVIQFAKSGNVTDAALAAARDRVPSGIPRDVFDTLARILVKRVPIEKAAVQLAGHYVERYAGKLGGQVLNQATKGLNFSAKLDPKLADMAKRAIGVGGDWTEAEIAAWGLPGRRVIVGGDEPVAYAVAGEGPIAVGQEEPIAVGGEEPIAYAVGEEPTYAVAGEEYAVGGEEPVAYAVGEEIAVGESYEVGGISPELLARLPHPSEWLSGRTRNGG